MSTGKTIQAVFFQSDSGSEPVKDWLHGLLPQERKAIGEDIKTVEFGWPIGMPTCRNLHGGIWEVRTNLEKKIARVFFCVDDGRMYLLHGIIKKSQKTPKEALELARKRKRRLFDER